jgi:ADP-ribose pyrophosphatase YjhB (NUDIX family)
MFDLYHSNKAMTMQMPSAFQSYKPRHMKVYGSIIINNEGEVLLVHGRLSKKWSFPKGHCKKGETDLQCASRELYEETGLVLNEKYTSYHKLKGGSYFVFAVTGRPLANRRDNREIDEVAWFPLKNINSIDTNVDVSIFNTLMKNIRCGLSVAEYMDTPEVQSRGNMITRSIV